MRDSFIEGLFKYHPPHGRQIAIYEEIRGRAENFAQYLVGHCPDNPDLTIAINKLRETVMWANSSLANEEVHDAIV